MKQKIRLDILLVQLGLVESREKAQALILAGKVHDESKRLDKPGLKIDPSTPVKIKGDIDPYVSRGAYKLKEAIKEFKITLENKVCLDIGASTGGFTQVCIEAGALKVYAIDAGENQLHWKIRSDKKVVSFEKTNIRHAESALIPEKCDFCCIDTSFISLKLVLPEVQKFLKPKAQCVALIKPQHEVGKDEVGKGGIVKDSTLHKKVIKEIKLFSEEIGYTVHGVIDSPITGTTGNKEFLIYLSYEK